MLVELSNIHKFCKRLTNIKYHKLLIIQMWWNKIKLQDSKSCKYPREECNADSMKALVKPEFQYIKHKILKSYSSAKHTYCYQPQS